MKLSFDIVGAGWARLGFATAEGEHEYAVSYITDAPRDLLMSVAAMLRGAPESSVRFIEEPDDVLLRLRRIDEVRVIIEAFRIENEPARRAASSVPDFSVETTLKTLGRQVASEFTRIERELGPIGYRERWKNYDFPAPELSALRGLLSERSTT